MSAGDYIESGRETAYKLTRPALLTPRQGVSVAVPSASNSGSRTYLVEGASGRVMPANTVHSSSASSTRVGRHGLEAVRASLSARDLAVLESVASHRYMLTGQIEGLHFADHASPPTAASVTRRVLRRLSSLRLLTHLERRIGGVRAGSASFVWRVGPVGSRMLGTTTTSPRRWQYEPGLRFLQHCLAVADAHLALVAAHRAAQLELLTVQLEPACWRDFTGLGGGRLVLQPDMYIVTGAGDFEDHWFIEIDRATESLNTVLAKCQHYEAYRRSGIEQSEGGGFPLVVWVVPDEERAGRLRSGIDRASGLTPAVFRVITPDRLVELMARGPA